MLETTILDQVRSVFQHLEARYVFHITYHPGHEQAQELIGFLKDVASCSDKLSCRMSEIENPVLEFTLLKDDVEKAIAQRRKTNGHKIWRRRKSAVSLCSFGSTCLNAGYDGHRAEPGIE